MIRKNFLKQVKHLNSLSKRKKYLAASLLILIVAVIAALATTNHASVQQAIDNNSSQTPVQSVQAAATTENKSGQDEAQAGTPTTPQSSQKTKSVAATSPKTTSPNPTPNQTPQVPTVTWAAFMNANVYCSNGVQLATIDNMRVYATNVPASGLTITWKWESSMPSLNYDVDDIVRTTAFPAGETHFLTLPDWQVFPYLYRASNTDASSSSFNGVIPAHSVRIHILTPNEAYTDWFAIPEFSTTVHPCQQ